jgi:tetratricopeptide (TPR) repeat protein
MARCCSSLSHVDERLDHLDEAVQWGERGLELARTIGGSSSLGTSHLALGVLYNRVGRSADAEVAFAASFEHAGNARSLARRRRVAAFSCFNISEYDRGIEHLNAALELFATGVDDPVGLAEAMQNLSEAQLALGNYSAAEEAALKGIHVTAKYRDRHREAWLLGVLATIEEATGNPAAAHQSRARAIHIFETEGVPTEAEKLRSQQTI